ncbi:MAG: DUF58 domain-containing protein [Alphaproteobacteria bacterium]|nr:DUF58 domain-containing protein [Alphaproteobacteria bacterium]
MSGADRRPALPIPHDRLQRALFKARHEMPSAGLGATRRRRLGQSLEYREHREYVAGDDIRNVDWRASTRYKGPTDRLVRAFEAEEQYSLIVALDTRPEMWAPEAAPPMLLGLWLAEALGGLAIAAKLTGTILPLFGSSGRTERPARGRAIGDRFATFLDRVWNERPRSDEAWHRSMPADASGLLRHLPPTAVVVIVTDGTFGVDSPSFGDIVRQAQRAHRHVSLVTLDGWPVERALLESLSVRLLPVGDFAGNDTLADPTAAELDAAERTLEEARGALLVQAGGLVGHRWTIPRGMTQAGLGQLFERQFEPFLRSSQIFAQSGR